MACALAGYQVNVQDVSADSLTRAESTLRGLMERRVEKGRITAEEVADAFARLSFTTELDAVATEADLVIEPRWRTCR